MNKTVKLHPPNREDNTVSGSIEYYQLSTYRLPIGFISGLISLEEEKWATAAFLIPSENANRFAD